MGFKKPTRLQIFRVILLGGTAVSLFFVPWILLRAWITPLPDSVQGQLDEALEYDFDGIVVYVNIAGEQPEYYAAGWHDKHHKIPARPKALFKIASVGKLYDAVSITKLVHDGKLSLDGTLARYFPELANRIEYANEITLKMMVEHRSGIPNFTDLHDHWNNPPSSAEKALERALDLPANFKPDDDYEYSNTNYLLLQMLIEKMSGTTKFSFLKERVLTPLNLTNTYGSLNDVNIDSLMSGYYVGVEEDIKSVDYGSMIATAEDVGIFLRALNDGSVFEGGERDIYSSIYEYDHTGLIPGYQTIAEYHEEMDAVVIQFVNTTNFQGYNWNLGEIVYGRVVKLLERR